MKLGALGALMITVLFIPSLANGQARPEERGRTWGYFFGGGGFFSETGGVDPSLSFGAGGEWQFLKTLGVSGEAGMIGVTGGDGAGAATFSANASYRFDRARPGERSLVPFVTGGYSSYSNDLGDGVNIGAGIDYWFRGESGLRFDVRGTRVRREDLVPSGPFVTHPWMLHFRIGLNFGRSSGQP